MRSLEIATLTDEEWDVVDRKIVDPALRIGAHIVEHVSKDGSKWFLIGIAGESQGCLVGAVQFVDSDHELDDEDETVEGMTAYELGLSSGERRVTLQKLSGHARAQLKGEDDDMSRMANEINTQEAFGMHIPVGEDLEPLQMLLAELAD